MGAFFYPMFANSVHAKNGVGRNVHVSDRENFLPNYREFTVGYD